VATSPVGRIFLKAGTLHGFCASEILRHSAVKLFIRYERAPEIMIAFVTPADICRNAYEKPLIMKKYCNVSDLRRLRGQHPATAKPAQHAPEGDQNGQTSRIIGTLTATTITSSGRPSFQ